jgi:guanylate kinase
MKYLITGSSGSGKSSIVEVLAKRGFSAYDTDSHDGVSILTDKKTGKPVDWPDPPIDWDRYSWDWVEDKINELLASDRIVFLAGAVNNQRKFYSVFDKIFVLTLDIETLRHRLLTRTSKDYGKHPEQLAGTLSYHPKLVDQLLSEVNSVAIDASQPLERVVDEILGYINEKPA